MSDEDEGGLGGLFGSVDDEVQPEYPVEELMVNRLANASEGCTNAGFEPLLDRFEGMNPLEGEDVEATLTRLRTRITALNPSPLRVFYRNKRHSLWGHKLWNAAKYLSKRMDEGMIDVFNKTVLELGAGLGVPALVAYRNGAKRVIVTDYPDADLLDVIQLNVTENCTPESVDEDQRQRYEDLYKRRVQQEGGDVVEGELSKEQKQAACSTMCVVEPLLWGKEEHIKKVMSYTNGQGFDVVILSDILFNHVCNDDLADTLALTLQKSPSAAAYCVFSHHRAHKELNDYEFFDKCVARGLHYEQIDEQDYELMFPEDRGPVEVRKPVKCYRIVHRFDAAGPGLDVSSVFDVAIQGTSLAQSYLAAALARSGLRVLVCDGEGSYGGPSATFGWEQFIEYIAEMGTNDAASSSRVLINEGHNLTETQRRRFLFDLLPSVHIARGEVIKQLISSGLTSNSGLEFQRAARFVFIEGLRHDVRSASATMVEVPLSRSGIFNTEMLSLMDKRRLMKFVKDVEATLAEELHAADANLGDLPVVERAVGQQDAASSVIQQAAAENPTEMLSSFLRRKYDLSPAAVDAVTVMKQLDKPTQVSSITEEAMPSLVQSAEYVRQMISSVGAYEGKTPFLVPAYGSSELAQGLCRSSAVWGGVAVLRRSMTRIVVDEEKERQYAVLSNGQYVRASIIVVPEEATSRLPVRLHDWRDVLERERQRNALGDGAVKEAFVVADCLGDRAPAGLTPRRTVARVVLALKTPLISWDSVREMSPVEGSDFTESPPIVVAFLRCASTGRMIELVQQSSSCDQASEGMAVVHFTTEELSVEELEAFVKLNFFKSKEDASTGSLGVLQSDVVLFSSFVIDGVQIAERSLNVLGKGGVDLPSETRKSHPYTIEECLKLQNATEQDRRLILHEGVDGPSKEAAPEKEQRAPPMVEVFTVPTISGNTLQQDAYLHAAQRVYEHIADVAVASSSMNVSKDRQKYVFLGCNTPTTD